MFHFTAFQFEFLERRPFRSSEASLHLASFVKVYFLFKEFIFYSKNNLTVVSSVQMRELHGLITLTSFTFTNISGLNIYTVLYTAFFSQTLIYQPRSKAVSTVKSSQDKYDR